MLRERVLEWTREWKEAGLQEGRREGRREILLTLLEHKFGAVDPTAAHRRRRDLTGSEFESKFAPRKVPSWI